MSQSFPWFPPTDISQRAGMLGPAGLDLLIRMLQCQPQNRISASDGLTHPYFNDHLARLHHQQLQQQQQQQQQQFVYQS